ncbi:MAG TPA: aldo/keto reductase, partial [Thermoclostridium caenicola]|nr:aldo/keto reductase [Thermoclostridium caenicola]
MEYRFLGKTGIKVSRLCFGALVIGPLQRNLSVEEGAAVIEEALRLGVNFI